MTFAWLGALNAFFAVAAGAFGAHGLKSRVSADMLAKLQLTRRQEAGPAPHTAMAYAAQLTVRF